MRIPDLEQMIGVYEEPLCKNCGRTKLQHIVVFVEDGPYSVVPAYKCMDNKYFPSIRPLAGRYYDEGDQP